MRQQSSLNKTSTILMVLFSFMLAWSQTLNVYAQNIDFNSCSSDYTYPVHPVADTEITTPIIISAEGAGGAPVTMEIIAVSVIAPIIGEYTICTSPPCGNPTVLGVNITVAGSTVTIDGTPDATSGASTIVLTVRATANATPCEGTFRLPIDRNPVALAIVLDQSLSMTWGYDGNYTPPADQQRWDGLVSGIGAMSTVLGTSDLLGGDKLDLILFSTTVNPSPVPFHSEPVPLIGNHGILREKIEDLVPSGFTALGNGIVTARTRLLDMPESIRKVMIVFSDGMQNEGDEVKTVAPNQYTHTAANVDINGNNEIEIFTICLGSSGHNPALMEGIANQNNGAYHITSTGDEEAFKVFFQETLARILENNSPQFINIKRSSFPESGGSASHIEEVFSINKGSSAVNVTFFVPSKYEAQVVSFTKDGTNLMQYAKKTQGSGFINISLKLPITSNPALTLHGDWKVGVDLSSGAKGEEVPYTCSIITDDHAIHPKYTTEKKNYKVGDTLRVGVLLNKLGKFIDNATVEVILAKPGDDVNNLIALANIDFDISSLDPGSPDVAKLAQLLKDPDFLNKIKTNNQVINVTYDASTHQYTGLFTGLDVSGVYQLFYRTTVDDADLGKIYRFHQKTIYVRFSDVDVPNSSVTITLGTNGNAVLKWRPKASNGKFIGSGWGGAIAIEGAGITTMTDHGDGSYTLVLDAPPETDVKIKLLDEDVYTGKLNDFGKGDGCKIFNIPCWIFWGIVILLILLILWLIFRKK